MLIEKAYKIHDAINSLEEKNKQAKWITESIADFEKFQFGELRLLGSMDNGTPVECHIPIHKDQMNPLLSMFLQIVEDNKKKNLEMINNIDKQE